MSLPRRGVAAHFPRRQVIVNVYGPPLKPRVRYPNDVGLTGDVFEKETLTTTSRITFLTTRFEVAGIKMESRRWLMAAMVSRLLLV
ncbi:hypothetical protein CDAR_370641 [Caerostris darwini]|uniref:Uncharacterized protein n=1 Tax=Caerostris darwini TaxID=1538125 RepID=A0AAV4VHU0_9ARAC|nr:hypothetical protein CDAR_370641 [Caerostris darwini]